MFVYSYSEGKIRCTGCLKAIPRQSVISVADKVDVAPIDYGSVRYISLKLYKNSHRRETRKIAVCPDCWEMMASDYEFKAKWGVNRPDELNLSSHEVEFTPTFGCKRRKGVYF